MICLRQLCVISVLVQTTVSMPHGSLFTGRYLNDWMGDATVQYTVYFYTADGVDYMDIALNAFVPQLGNRFIVLRRLRYTENTYRVRGVTYHGIGPNWDSASPEALAGRQQMVRVLKRIFYIIALNTLDARLPDPETFLDTIVYDPEDAFLFMGLTETTRKTPPPVIETRDAIRMPLLAAAAAAVHLCTIFNNKLP